MVSLCVIGRLTDNYHCSAFSSSVSKTSENLPRRNQARGRQFSCVLIVARVCRCHVRGRRNSFPIIVSRPRWQSSERRLSALTRWARWWGHILLRLRRMDRRERRQSMRLETTSRSKRCLRRERRRSSGRKVWSTLEARAQHWRESIRSWRRLPRDSGLTGKTGIEY